MLKKLTLSQLLTSVTDKSKLKGIHLHLVSDDAFLFLLKEKLKKQFGDFVLLDGPQAMQKWCETYATPNLFGDQPPHIVMFPEKGGVKVWKPWYQMLQKHLQDVKESAVPYSCFILPLSLRTTLNQADLKEFDSSSVTFSPQLQEQQICGTALAKLFSFSQKQSAPDLAVMVEKALRYYNENLISVYQHWERMEKSSLNFEEALLSHVEINAFDVVQAVAERDVPLVHMRLKQCMESALEANAVWGALVHFMKQCAHLRAQVEGQPNSQNLKKAFDVLQIPFPMQERLSKVMRHYSALEISHFFLAAPQIELLLRKQRSSWDILAHEIQSWVTGFSWSPYKESRSEA